MKQTKNVHEFFSHSLVVLVLRSEWIHYLQPYFRAKKWILNLDIDVSLIGRKKNHAKHNEASRMEGVAS
jgi:hypothetical protein